MAAGCFGSERGSISAFMSEENENQPPVQTDAPSARPRRPRRRFPRRHNRGPQDQRENFNGPADRGDRVVAEENSGGPRVNEDEQREDGGVSQNGEIEREPEYGDGIIEISGKGFGFL